MIEERQVTGQGIELGHDQVASCIARGVPVIQQDIDSGLQAVPDASFDYVILEETLQTLHRPVMVLARDAASWPGRDCLVSKFWPLASTRRPPHPWTDADHLAPGSPVVRHAKYPSPDPG